MVLTIHHLQISQSCRVVWLCEELGIPYELIYYERFFSPPESLLAVNPLGQAPVITDDGMNLAESGAIIEYIIHKHGNGRFALPPSHPNYAQYLYWYHFANGTLQPAIVNALMLFLGGVGSSNMMVRRGEERLDAYFKLMDKHLSSPDFPYLAGKELTGADFMNIFCLTQMRAMFPLDLTPYPNIIRYLQEKIGTREAYVKASKMCDPEAPLALDAKPPAAFWKRMITPGWIGAILAPVRSIVRLVAILLDGITSIKVKRD
jgi:glutathione S-transferase